MAITITIITMLNKSDEYVLPDFRGITVNLLINYYDISCGSVRHRFYYVKISSFYKHIVKSFIIKRC